MTGTLRRLLPAALLAALVLVAMAPPVASGDVPDRYDPKTERPVSARDKIKLIEKEYEKLLKKVGLSGPKRRSVEIDPKIAALPSPYEPGTPISQTEAIETEHYRFRSDAHPKLVEAYARQMEAFYDKFCDAFSFDKELEKKSEIWLYRDKDTFMKRENKGANVGGFYQPGNRRVTAYHGKFGMSSDTRTVLAHEGTHQFQHLVASGIFQQAPTWIIEGLAVYFESARYDGKKVHINEIPRDRLMVVQRAIKAGNYVPIRELIEVPQPKFTGFHYAHAWSVIYWFVWSHKKNRTVFTKYWDMCRQRKAGRKEFEKAIGVEIDELEEHWKEWVLKLNPNRKPSFDD